MFSEIWNKHKVHLLNFIKTKVSDEHMADDILQEVSIKLHHNLSRKEEIRNYKTWLFQVTRNTIVDYYRKNKKHTEITVNQVEINTSSNACVCDLSAFIIQNYLPKEYSKVLYLSDIEQKPQQEIAKILNLSLPATKSRIQRGRKKLKELITDCVDVSYNDKGEVSDFELKNSCKIPQELKDEMDKINLFP